MALGLKEIGIISAGVPLIAGKFYLGHKYLEYRKRRARERAGLGMPLQKFAALPRRRQAGIIGYRRRRLRELEGAYYMGGTRRRRRLF